MKISSEGEAKRLIFEILPEDGVRQECLTILADAIAEANSYGRDKWAVVYTAEKVRLIVGHLIIFTLANRPEHGPIWMALDKELLETSNYQSLLEQIDDWS